MDFKFEEANQYEPVDNCRSVSLHNRRDKERVVASGELLIAWHHEPDQLRAYSNFNISENGAKIFCECYLPDGLTGRAVMHRPTGIRINRTCMVAWCKPVRDSTGQLKYYEAGMRFF